MKFFGREEELDALERLRKKSTSSLAVIWGRRRIGKSRLIQEFTRGKNVWNFTGLAPSPLTTAEDQIESFSSQMARATGMPKLKSDDWGEVLWHLGEQAQKEKELILVFDEISWMGSKDHNFLGHLKNEWDRSLSQHKNLILILCGSVSSWIEKNILSSTGFVGRISLKLEVKELPIEDCNAFWGSRKNRVSAYEKFMLLSVTGGVPKYLEEIIPGESAEQNIRDLCFIDGGILRSEYENIFSDLFDSRAPTFERIVNTLSGNGKNLDEICAALKIKKSGNITQYLKELKMAGFITEDTTWNAKTKKLSNLKTFRLKDNYIRFYLQFIKPKKHTFPLSESILGLQFENLVLSNIEKICRVLAIEAYDFAGAYFQKATKRQRGCQIDLLIQTKRTQYLFEIKFRRSAIGMSVIEEVEEKMERLSTPRGFSKRPILIHVNGVTDDLIDADFFDHIIDFSEFLKK